tara:strand:+ start:147 stop:851 length:705 start_codon:yes stop_codon:yes gene_type:complete
MLNKLIFFSIFLIFNNLFSQELTGKELLEKTINFHDPKNNWIDFNGSFTVKMITPDGKKRESLIEIDLYNELFSMSVTKDQNKTFTVIDKSECKIIFNGSESFSVEDKKKYRLSCKDAFKMKNYYTYLYGLPMKLNDPGTILDSIIKRRKFKGKEYLVLKVTYEESVGKDTWYFYFDPLTYAMQVYQFFKDETQNDGEYIILEDLEKVNGIKMPKTRSWFFNKDDKYLGKDILN